MYIVFAGNAIDVMLTEDHDGNSPLFLDVLLLLAIFTFHLLMMLTMHDVQNTDELLDSLQTTGHALGRLKLSQLRLQQDAANKRAAANFDSTVIRMRKRQQGNYCA